MKNKYLVIIIAFALVSCMGTSTGNNSAKPNFPTGKSISEESVWDIYHVMLIPSQYKFKMPGLNSFALAKADGDTWVVLAGKKDGYHGTDEQNSFLSSVANDSIWVIDLEEQMSWGAPIPGQFRNSLSCSNPQSYQIGNSLYFCGGFTRQFDTNDRSNWTSDLFIEFDINALVSYVKTGGDFARTILKQFNSPYVQVTGGEMYANENYIYLIGGQNYDTTYIGGYNGKYTNAVRRFSIDPDSSGGWVITDTSSYIDPINLHRRDHNVVEVLDNSGNVVPAIFGGVFTPGNGAYTNPVYIFGCESGNISIKVDTTLYQKNNLYKCASFSIAAAGGSLTMVNLIGGITGYSWERSSNSLKAGTPLAPGSNMLDSLPWSNMNNILWTTSGFTVEVLQLPSNGAKLLPGYLGSDAKFIALEDMLLEGYPSFIDGNKLAPQGDTISIGYMYGGIKSNGPTTQWIPSYVNTEANNVLYEVKITRIVP